MSPTANRDNREAVIYDFTLYATVNYSSYIKSFAVDTVLAAAAPKP